MTRLLLLLSPTAPHLCDELWERLGLTGTVYEQPWPEADQDIAAAEKVTIVIQVNGKVRGRLEVPAGTPMDEVEKLALAEEAVQRALEGKSLRKVIPVPDKLVNIVIG
jgi:leucyl-tRNA synthetase